MSPDLLCPRRFHWLVLSNVQVVKVQQMKRRVLLVPKVNVLHTGKSHCSFLPLTRFMYKHAVGQYNSNVVMSVAAAGQRDKCQCYLLLETHCPTT